MAIDGTGGPALAAAASNPVARPASGDGESAPQDEADQPARRRADGGADGQPAAGAGGRAAATDNRVDNAAVSLEVAAGFRDPDGDPLTYRATSSAPAVAATTVSGSTVTVTSVAAGTATVTVRATDPSGRGATQSFRVAVTATATGSFSDDPLVPGVTPVKAVHFTELRTRIDALRATAGLQRVTWTDPVLGAGVTPVRLVHLLELRSALEVAYAAAGRSAPSYTDAAPAAGIPIRATHLMELRVAVVALE